MPAANAIISRILRVVSRLLVSQNFYARRKATEKGLKSTAPTKTCRWSRRLRPAEPSGSVSVTQCRSFSSTSNGTEPSEVPTQLDSNDSVSVSRAGSSRSDPASRVTSRSRNFVGPSSRVTTRSRTWGGAIGSRPTSRSRNSPCRRSSNRARTLPSKAAMVEMKTSQLNSTCPPSYIDVVNVMAGSPGNEDAPPTYESIFRDLQSGVPSSPILIYGQST